MRRTTNRQLWGSLASSTLALVLLGAVNSPATAQDGVTAVDAAEPSTVVELDPTDFDPVTITDTEVARMRRHLMAERWTATMIDERAASRLADTVVRLTTARTELDARTDELAVLENTLGAAAIEGYLSDIESESVAFLGQYVESDATFADETATQLLARRREARQAVATATVEVGRAEQAQRIAVSHKAQTARSLESVQERRRTFDDLAEQHATAARRADDAAAALSDEVELRSVAGAIIINSTLENEADRLIADARADGLALSGGGYRTVEAQIALRLLHCGGSLPSALVPPTQDATPEERAAYESAVAAHQHYVIYEMPAGACSPPTATPGNSEHQLGLAIDFTLEGSILDSSSEGYQWLVEHAVDYGLINLPSEAWHWSTTGH